MATKKLNKKPAAKPSKKTGAKKAPAKPVAKKATKKVVVKTPSKPAKKAPAKKAAPKPIESPKSSFAAAQERLQQAMSGPDLTLKAVAEQAQLRLRQVARFIKGLANPDEELGDLLVNFNDVLIERGDEDDGIGDISRVDGFDGEPTDLPPEQVRNKNTGGPVRLMFSIESNGTITSELKVGRDSIIAKAQYEGGMVVNSSGLSSEDYKESLKSDIKAFLLRNGGQQAEDVVQALYSCFNPAILDAVMFSQVSFTKGMAEEADRVRNLIQNNRDAKADFICSSQEFDLPSAEELTDRSLQMLFQVGVHDISDTLAKLISDAGGGTPSEITDDLELGVLLNLDQRKACVRLADYAGHGNREVFKKAKTVFEQLDAKGAFGEVLKTVVGELAKSVQEKRNIAELFANFGAPKTVELPKEPLSEEELQKARDIDLPEGSDKVNGVLLTKDGDNRVFAHFPGVLNNGAELEFGAESVDKVIAIARTGLTFHDRSNEGGVKRGRASQETHANTLARIGIAIDDDQTSEDATDADEEKAIEAQEPESEATDGERKSWLPQNVEVLSIDADGNLTASEAPANNGDDDLDTGEVYIAVEKVESGYYAWVFNSNYDSTEESRDQALINVAGELATNIDNLNDGYEGTCFEDLLGSFDENSAPFAVVRAPLSVLRAMRGVPTTQKAENVEASADETEAQEQPETPAGVETVTEVSSTELAAAADDDDGGLF